MKGNGDCGLTHHKFSQSRRERATRHRRKEDKIGNRRERDEHPLVGTQDYQNHPRDSESTGKDDRVDITRSRVQQGPRTRSL